MPGTPGGAERRLRPGRRGETLQPASLLIRTHVRPTSVAPDYRSGLAGVARREKTSLLEIDITGPGSSADPADASDDRHSRNATQHRALYADREDVPLIVDEQLRATPQSPNAKMRRAPFRPRGPVGRSRLAGRDRHPPNRAVA